MSEQTTVVVAARLVIPVSGSGDNAKEQAVAIASDRYPGLAWVAERVNIPWGT